MEYIESLKTVTCEKKLSTFLKATSAITRKNTITEYTTVAKLKIYLKMYSSLMFITKINCK